MKHGKKVAGLKGGGHYNRTGVGKGNGHGIMPHGELPNITAATDGRAITAAMSDKLKFAAVRGRSIMVQRYSTNDPGKPKSCGPRYACGVIPK